MGLADCQNVPPTRAGYATDTTRLRAGVGGSPRVKGPTEREPTDKPRQRPGGTAAARHLSPPSDRAENPDFFEERT